MFRLIFTLLLILAMLPLQGQTEKPCQSSNHRAFDFWVGDWRVTLADGTHAGDNSITLEQNDCVVKEHWTSASGSFTGTSLNFYDTQKGQWRQLWLDNQGGSLDLAGQKQDKQMVLRTSDFEAPDGVQAYHQISWTENDDGSVRQLWETFTVGEEAKVIFDGLYQKSN